MLCGVAQRQRGLDELSIPGLTDEHVLRRRAVALHVAALGGVANRGELRVRSRVRHVCWMKLLVVGCNRGAQGQGELVSKWSYLSAAESAHGWGTPPGRVWTRPPALYSPWREPGVFPNS